MNNLDSVTIIVLLTAVILIVYNIHAPAEGFNVPVVVSEPVDEVIGNTVPTVATVPTAVNPFMNVLIDEIKYKPLRGAALSVEDPLVQLTIDEYYKTQSINDPTDVFSRTQSQRQFITMPSTTIPSDRESYQNWLYKIPGKTCKEGGREACIPGTDGGALPWLNN